MTTPHFFRLGAFVVPAVCLLAPGLPGIARSSYGFHPPELWFVVLYLGGIYVALFSLCQRLLSAIATRALWERLSASILLAAGLPLLIPLAAMAPFVAIAMSLRGQAGSALLSRTSLARRYLEYFLLTPIETHVWLIVPSLVCLLAWLSFRVKVQSMPAVISENTL